MRKYFLAIVIALSFSLLTAIAIANKTTSTPLIVKNPPRKLSLIPKKFSDTRKTFPSIRLECEDCFWNLEQKRTKVFIYQNIIYIW